jgi:hypothetical protein
LIYQSGDPCQKLAATRRLDGQRQEIQKLLQTAGVTALRRSLVPHLLYNGCDALLLDSSVKIPPKIPDRPPKSRILLRLVLALFALAVLPCRGAEVSFRPEWAKIDNEWALRLTLDDRGAQTFMISSWSPAFSNPKLIRVMDASGEPVSFRIAKPRDVHFIELIFPQLARPRSLSLHIDGLIVSIPAGKNVSYDKKVTVSAPPAAVDSSKWSAWTGAPPDRGLAGTSEPVGGGVSPTEHKKGQGAKPPERSTNGHPSGEAAIASIPEFKIPPPLASASQEVPRLLLVGDKTKATLGDAETALNHAFEQCDYGDKKYYALRDKSGVRDGFALASRLEHINPDGTASEDRWSREVVPMRTFSIGEFVHALFRARPGHYRVIVFVLTNKPLTQDIRMRVNSKQADLWTQDGANALPKEMAEMEYTTDYRCTALIYEFKSLANGEATFVEPSDVSGKRHLAKSGLWAALQQSR